MRQARNQHGADRKIYVCFTEKSIDSKRTARCFISEDITLWESQILHNIRIGPGESKSAEQIRIILFIAQGRILAQNKEA
jgi:hypothetical protein